MNINNIPTEEYLERGRKVVNEQLAIAGYRLADAMQQLHHKRYHSFLNENVSY